MNLVSADLITGLEAYWEMSDNSDSTDNANTLTETSITYQGGKIGDGAVFGGSSDYELEGESWPDYGVSGVDMTFNFWVNQSAEDLYDFFGTMTTSNNGYTFYKSAADVLAFYDGVNYLYTTWDHPINEWVMITIRINSTNISTWVNGTEIGHGIRRNPTNGLDFKIGNLYSGAGAFVGMIDEFKIYNRSLTESEISVLFGGEAEIVQAQLNVELTSPIDDFSSSKIGLNFTGNYTTTNSNLTNATYYIWDSTGVIFNDTETILINGTVNGSTHEINNFTLETYHWNIFICGENATQAICNWSVSNYTFTVGATIDNETHITNVFETSNQRFGINISLISGATLYQSKLYYNGTAYTATIVNKGSNKYSTYKSIDIPTVKSNYDNLTFFWSLTYEKADGSFINQNLSIYTQTVNLTHLELCDATYTIPYINFTTKNATNPFPNLNATFKVAWDYWLGTGDYKKNISFEDVSEGNHTFSFCVEPGYRDIYADAQIEFDGTGSSQNYHYLTDAHLTNSTNMINLYLLDNSKSTITILEVRDEAQSPIPNIIISIQFYDVGTDTYYTVGMAKTNYIGKDLVYLNWYDSFYKFVLTNAKGEMVSTTTPYKISTTPQVFEILTEIPNPFAKFAGFVYTLAFNEATDNFILTFTKPSGLVDRGCLRVIKRSLQNDTTICNACETSNSATLYCNVAAYGNGTFIASFYATGSFEVIDTLIYLKNVGSELYDLIGNVDGTIYAFLFSGIALAMFFVSPVLAILGLLLGMLGGMVLGFQPLDWVAFITIAVVGGITIWTLKR